MIYLLPFISGLLWAFSTLSNKKNSSNKINAIDNSLLFNLSSLVVSIILLVFFTITFPLSLNSYIYMFFSVCFSSIGYIYYFKSLEITDISLLSILNRFSLVVTAIGGILIFAERFSYLQILGICLIGIGIFSPGINNLKYLNRKGSVFALISGSFFGLSSLCDKFASKDFSPIVYIFLSFALTVFFFLVLKLFSKRTKSKRKETNKNYFWIYLAGALNALALFVLIYSYSLGSGVFFANIISQIRLPVILFFGILFFKEKEISTIKIVSAILIIIGAVFLQLH